jgi:hypothetical protein
METWQDGATEREKGEGKINAGMWNRPKQDAFGAQNGFRPKRTLRNTAP